MRKFYHFFSFLFISFHLLAQPGQNLAPQSNIKEIKGFERTSAAIRHFQEQKAKQPATIFNANKGSVEDYKRMVETIREIRRKVERNFDDLNKYNFLTETQRKQFKEFLPEIYKLLDQITQKIYKRKILPSCHPTFPENGVDDEYKEINVGLFIGSFAPFHMGHLITALRHLANPDTDSDFVLVVPSADPENVIISEKPHKIAFDIRQEWVRKQIEDFAPLLRFSGVGKTRNPSQIVEELISDHPGFNIHLTQVVGSDPIVKNPKLPNAIKEDVTNWRNLSELLDSKFDYGLHIMERKGYEISKEMMKEKGYPEDLRIFVESGTMGGRASSTRFNVGVERGIFYPKEDIVREFKPIFLLERYGVHAATRPILHMLEENERIDDASYMKKVMQLVETVLSVPSYDMDKVLNVVKAVKESA